MTCDADHPPARTVGPLDASGRGGRAPAWAAVFTTALLLGACAEAPSALDPHGPRAERLADLWWLLFWLGTAVALATFAVLAVALVRASRRRPGATVGQADGRLFIVIGGVALPAVILVGLMVATVWAGDALGEPDEPAGLVIEVIGWQYWWEVRYPGAGFTTANEIHMPAGTPVQVRLSARDVIHSFWVPQLGGKLDLIPGQTNTTWLTASEPGVYRGQCAEFCGIQHAKMAFHVVADPPEQFAAWVAAQQRAAAQPQSEAARRGREVFAARNCAVCHAVRGSADGRAAPDLTHLMSREWIAAGTLRNTPTNLATWITAAQTAKRGAGMPSYPDLSAEELAALLAYLETLE